jgi:hypothetical protein
MLTETAWLFSAIAVTGLILDLPGSSVAWPMVLLAMGIPLAIGHADPTRFPWAAIAIRFRVPVGILTLYLVIASQVADGAFGLDPSWPITAFLTDRPNGYRLSVAIGVAVGALLWRIGAGLADTEDIGKRLTRSMRLGVPVLAFAAAVNITRPEDLGTLPLVLIFFAAGLGGLSINRSTGNDSQSANRLGRSTTPYVPIAAVLLAGVAFVLIRKGVLSNVSDSAVSSLASATKAVLWAIFIPIAFVGDLAIRGFLKIFDKPFNPPTTDGSVFSVEEAQQAADRLFDDAPIEETASSGHDLLIQIAQWSLGAFIVLLAAALLGFLFMRSFRGRRRPGSSSAPVDRDSVREEADVASDLSGLLRKLLPHWGNAPSDQRAYTLPDGPKGVVDALAFYYDLLTAAEGRGLQRESGVTATEFQTTLEATFPRSLVHAATRAFNHALYGNHPAHDDYLAGMRAELDAAMSEPG